MIEFTKGTEMMDRPEILNRLFFPRREPLDEFEGPGVKDYLIGVEEGISIGCRFYESKIDGPNILYFHGNGETCADYDYVAPVYRSRGLNLFVADYRGYGVSDGSPTCTAMIKDSHPIFNGFVSSLQDLGFNGDMFVMGRSLGSAPALEIAYHYQDRLKGLILESGFASSRNQFSRIGVADLFRDNEDAIGFGNDLKIKSVTIPTLIIHGEDDYIIPATEGRALYAFSGASKKASLFIPDAGHNDLMMVAISEYMGAVEKFCKNV